MQINPVIEKELKIKMRGWKAPTLITVYIVFLGLIVFFSFLGSKILSPYSMGQFNPSTALSSYNALAILQLLLIMFIVPAMTGGAISGEKERQTLDLLLCTNLSTSSIVVGKIVVSIAHIMLLIAASLPIMSVVFLYGGITVTDLLLLFAFYLVTALALGSIGIFYSTIFRKSSVSMILSYMTVLFLLFGTIIVYGIWSSIFMRFNNKPPDIAQTMAFMFANPMFGFNSLVEGTSFGIPFFGDLFRFGMRGYYGGGQTGTIPQLFGITLKPWMINMAFDAAASVILVLVSSFKIKPIKRFRRRKRTGNFISTENV